MNLPRKINIGSGKSWREDFINIDISSDWNPDVLVDFGFDLIDGELYETKRFGLIELGEGSFRYIISDNVFEHIRDLPAAMKNCIKLLEVGGILEIIVPYDLSYGAWQDPTHVRAFNEKSWLYYTEWCWYLGWVNFKFDLIFQNFILSEYGKELVAKKSISSPLQNLCSPHEYW